MDDTIDWAKYVPYIPMHDGPWEDLDPREAKESYDHWIASRSERLQRLSGLLGQHNLALTSDNAGLVRLENWLLDSIEPGTELPDFPAPRWYAVVNDIGVFLGGTMIERCPGLKWTFFSKSKRYFSYQKPVIQGFTKVKNPMYNIDPDWLVQTYAERAIVGESGSRGHFLELMRSAEGLA